MSWYWSSTESDEICAWDVYMGNGVTIDDTKRDNDSVRAVSAF